MRTLVLTLCNAYRDDKPYQKILIRHSDHLFGLAVRTDCLFIETIRERDQYFFCTHKIPVPRLWSVLHCELPVADPMYR